jgi:hypothetical protein
MTIQIFSSGFAIGQTKRVCLNRKSNFTCGSLSILCKQKIRKMMKKIVTIGFLMQYILGWIVDCDDFFYHFSDSFLQKLPLSHRDFLIICMLFSTFPLKKFDFSIQTKPISLGNCKTTQTQY